MLKLKGLLSVRTAAFFFTFLLFYFRCQQEDGVTTTSRSTCSIEPMTIVKP